MSTTPDVYSKPRNATRDTTEESVLAMKPLPHPYETGGGLGVVFAVCDAAIVLGAGTLAYTLAVSGADGRVTDAPSHFRLFGFLTCYAVLTLICKASQGLYATSILHSAQISRVRTLKSLLLSSMLMILVLFLSDPHAVSPPLLATTVVISLAGILMMHEAVQLHNLKRIERGIGVQHVLIVGAGQIGQAFRDYLEMHSYLGKMFCGFVDQSFRSGPDWLGTFDDLPRLMREHFIDEIYFTPEMDRALVMDVAAQARESGISVKVVPDLYDGLALGAGVTYIGNVPVLQLSSQATPALQGFLKRMLDVCAASFAVIITSPLMLMAALATKLDSPGPVIYSAWRVGRKGRKFRCYKFRTMVADADAQKENLRHMNQRNGATFKIANDPRITRVGRVLRRYSIDELPQFFNVLKGDMSIVGPRPHPVDDYEQYRLADLRRLDVLPGITGLWQVSARHDPSFEKNVMLDLEYIQNWTVWMDMKIILRTVPEIFRGSGH